MQTLHIYFYFSSKETTQLHFLCEDLWNWPELKLPELNYELDH